MPKASLLLLIFLLSHSFLIFGQTPTSVLESPESWTGEIIPFPIDFAPGIALKGIEELRFAPGWSDSTSEAFWTYAFVWYVEPGPKLTEQLLTSYFDQYYDGLMQAVLTENKLDSIKPDPTLSLFLKTDKGFKGKMRVFDSFFTRDYFTLYIRVREAYCPEEEKQLISCHISPQPFEDKIWEAFGQIKAKVSCQ